MYTANQLGRAGKHSKGGWALFASAPPCAHLRHLLGRMSLKTTKKILGQRLWQYQIKLLLIVMYSYMCAKWHFQQGGLLHYANSIFAFQKQWIIDPKIIRPANQMNWAMHLLGELTRNRRRKLKKKCYPKDVSKEDVIKSKPAWADKQHYKELVDYWFLPTTQVSLFSCSIIFQW